MKIAMYNVNNTNGGLMVMHSWQKEAQLGVVYSHGLNLTNKRLLTGIIIGAGYDAIWRCETIYHTPVKTDVNFKALPPK